MEIFYLNRFSNDAELGFVSAVGSALDQMCNMKCVNDKTDDGGGLQSER